MTRRGTYEEFWGRPVWVPDPYDDDDEQDEYSYAEEANDRDEAPETGEEA